MARFERCTRRNVYFWRQCGFRLSGTSHGQVQRKWPAQRESLTRICLDIIRPVLFSVKQQ